MKNFGFIQKIRLKRAISYFTLLALLVFFAFAVSTNLIGNIAKTKAVDINGVTIYQDTNTDESPYNYDTSSVRVTGAVEINGKHTFDNLTVTSTGFLTSADYNKYGVSARNVETSLLANNNSWKYAYVMRGFIDTGTVHNLTYSVTSGQWLNSSNKTIPNSMYPDDYGQINFYSPVAINATYDNSLWDSANIIDYAYSELDADEMHQYTDSGVHQSTDALPIIPFELRFLNTGGQSFFGITSCGTAPCTDRDNNRFIQNVAYSTPFSATVTPQIKSLIAWQGDAQIVSYGVTNYSSMNTYFNNRSAAIDSATGLNYADYYVANHEYDFANDKKIVLETNTNVLSNPDMIDTISQYENVNGLGSNYRGYSNFYPLSGYNQVTPLASRRAQYPDNDDYYTDYGYPILSRSLYQTFRDQGKIIVPTEITVNGTFTVETGGVVNLDAKGFNASRVYKGAGPGGGNDVNGASHSGLGGDGLTAGGSTVTPAYDTSMSEPLFPGSGAFTGSNGDLSGTLMASQYHYGDGGGYIKIVAKKIVLNNGSMVRANANNGNYYQDNPKGAASGGSIILIDNDASSSYNSLVTAMGGWCHDPLGGGACEAGGGGGGYIFISSKSDVSYLESRKNYYRSFPDPTSVANGLPVDFYTGYYHDTDWWMEQLGIPSAMLSVSGGRAESNWEVELHRGKPGIINISGGSSAYKLKKSLQAVDRPGAGASFNPYALQLDDVIRVMIEADQLASGSVIRDNILRVPGSTYGYRCEPIANTQNPSNGIINPNDSVVWNVDANTQPPFSYNCRVIKN